MKLAANPIIPSSNQSGIHIDTMKMNIEVIKTIFAHRFELVLRREFVEDDFPFKLNTEGSSR